MGEGNTFLSDTAGVCSVLVLLLETCTSVPSICMQRCHKNRVWLACECDTRLCSFHLTKLIQYLSWITVSRCFVCVCVHVSPSCGMILRVTLRPASLISLTMSACGMLTMDWLFTASILSPTFSFPQRSAGLPSMMRPILWGTAVGAFTHATAGKDALGSRLEDYASLCSHTTHWLNVSLPLSFCYSPQAYVRHPVFLHVCGGEALMLRAVRQICVWLTCCGRACIIEELEWEALHFLPSRDLAYPNQ